MSEESDSYSYDSEDYTWIERHIQKAKNGSLCAVDEEFIRDSFNLYGLDEHFPCFKEAKDLILDVSEKCDRGFGAFGEEEINCAAERLYGLIHARFILTEAGLRKMESKYKTRDFGVCPRTYCHETRLLPAGLSDLPEEEQIKLFCPCCKDVYNVSSDFSIDGAYIGTTFPHLFLLTYPQYKVAKKESYSPTVYGYKIHKSSPYYK